VPKVPNVVFRDFLFMECYLLRILYRHFALVRLTRLPLVSPSLHVPYFGGGTTMVVALLWWSQKCELKLVLERSDSMSLMTDIPSLSLFSPRI
jgi:hypothetical protein